jgi:Ni/Co efflux regulator RcnB
MKRIINAALMMSLLAGSTAFADSIKGSIEQVTSEVARAARENERRDDRHDRRDERRDDRWDRRDDRRDERWDRRDDRRDAHWDRRDYRWDRRHDWRDHRHGRVWAGDYRFPRGYRPYSWRRGDRLPRAYYDRPYVVRDYHRCHLRPPPRGAHWVRVNQDVVLAAIATGIVLDVLYNHFY